MSELRAVGVIIFAFFLIALSEALPDWLLLLSGLAIVWRLVHLPQLPRPVLYGTVVVAWSLLILDTSTIWHRNTLTSAIAVATLFNLLAPPHRQRAMRYHAGLFALLVATLVVPGSTYPLWIYFGLCLSVCASLILHHLPRETRISSGPLSKDLARLALPVTAILLPVYFLFPDLRKSPNWQARSGLSGSLEPGQIAELALSERLAFRVRFKSPPPGPAQLYWRADVLERSRGMSWTRSFDTQDQAFNVKTADGPVRYEIMYDSALAGATPLLEETLSLNAQDGIQMWQPDKRVYRSNAQYLEVVARASSQYQALTPPLMPEVNIDLTPRLQELVNTLKILKPEDQVAHLLDLFRTYHYTLRPGRLTSENQLDEFMFESRRGFCEHYAASFASLLRLAGTPARVVVGYQGGSALAAGGYYQINGSDAHAWTEVWLAGTWQRFDPSSITINGSQEKPDRSSLSAMVFAWLSFQMQGFTDWFKGLTDDWSELWFVLIAAFGGFVAIQVYRMMKKGRSVPAWEKKLIRLQKKIEKSGLERQTAETMYDFLTRASEARDLPELKKLAELVNLRRYSQEKTPELESLLSQSLKRISQSRSV